MTISAVVCSWKLADRNLSDLPTLVGMLMVVSVVLGVMKLDPVTSHFLDYSPV
jgi:hypothetical protein